MEDNMIGELWELGVKELVDEDLEDDEDAPDDELDMEGDFEAWRDRAPRSGVESAPAARRVPRFSSASRPAG